jgi:hypothetical protein
MKMVRIEELNRLHFETRVRKNILKDTIFIYFLLLLEGVCGTIIIVPGRCSRVQPPASDTKVSHNDNQSEEITNVANSRIVT